MAQTADHYKKYQVYFFLYLAVICELLIIIVERDDAEADLLMQQRLLEEKNRKIILELLKNMPAVAAAGDNQLKVGEERKFTINVKGLGEEDEVTTPPEVKVFKDGLEISSLRYPEQIEDSVVHGATGERLYRFTWSADNGPGTYELWVQAGTNRVSLTPDIDQGAAKIKVGTLEFSRKEIRTALDSDPELKGTPVEHFIEQSENLNPDKFIVEVVSEEYDQLQIQADPLVTAVGFPSFNEIKVRGTTVDKISNMNILGGGVALRPDNPRNPFYSPDPERGKWVWSNTYNEPGPQTVTVDARDSRAAGPKSVSRPISFNVEVKQPYLARRKPFGAFAGEFFEMYVNVAGLENAGSYKWSIELDGNEVTNGTGNVVKYKVPEDALGQSLIIKSTYSSRVYQVLIDSASESLSTSEFLFNVTAPVDRIGSQSFANSGEYPINNVFQFVAARCGRCISSNIENIQPSDIRVEVESEDGQDLLDEVQVIPRTNPNTGEDQGSLVKFWLRGKVSRDGSEATITIRFGSVNERYTVLLYQE
ncbi:MAG: hypothetical protein C0600_10150 [Ignavibacteria bacterium]|nr:MAG: hypothetical protein C0600_10150 [Ignavibacteria bacterium]